MGLRGIFLAIALLFGAAHPAFAQMPLPTLVFDGVEQYATGGQYWVRYKLKVTNSAAFSLELFTPAPDLPPCGANTNASRSWVDIYSGTVRLNGFCALASPAGLDRLWIALPSGQPPPPWAYITITDRQANRTVTSNPVKLPSQ